MKLFLLTLFILFVCLLTTAFLLTLTAPQKGVYENTNIANISVDNLNEIEAAQKVRKELKKPEVVVSIRDDKYKIKGKDIDFKYEINQSLEKAEQGLREGSSFQRGFDQLFANKEETRVPVDFTYNKEKIKEWVKKIADDYFIKAKDGKLQWSGNKFVVEKGNKGQELSQKDLQRKILKAFSKNKESAKVKGMIKESSPSLNKLQDFKKKYPVYLVVDKSAFELTLYNNLKAVETYPVATGMPGFDTPEGSFSITNKAVDPAWSVPSWGGSLAGQVIPGGTAENPLKERWLGIYDGVGIHGTADVASLGSQASHGCVRMDPDQVIELYDKVPVGTPVIIEA